MIVQITQGVGTLALRIKESMYHSQLIDWRNIQLIIHPGQIDTHRCGPNGSPWYFFGCWPGVRTGVDLANPPMFPPVPTLHYSAYELDADGRIVFRFDAKFHNLPVGRYTGVIRAAPKNKIPINLPLPKNVKKNIVPSKHVIPEMYLGGNQNCSLEFPQPPPPLPRKECCVLAIFDIDLGPRCFDHIIDQAVVNCTINTCGDEHGEAS